MESGRAALVHDSARDERFVTANTGFAIGSLVAVPMIAGGRTVGVLSVSASSPGMFSERELDLAQLLANCTAPAIETARLAHLAVTDDLTRAYNMRYLAPRMDREVELARDNDEHLSVLMLDLDHFKEVNDRHGHAVGDEVLRGFAARVRSTVRETDVLVRRGGEEFLLLMPQTPTETARTIAERVRTEVASRPIVSERAGGVRVRVSIGVATWREGESATDVEARADAALYRAKANGRDRVEVSEEPIRV